MGDKTRAELQEELATMKKASSDKDVELEELQDQLENVKTQASSPESMDVAQLETELAATRERAEAAEQALKGGGSVIVSITDLHADVPEGAYCFRSKFQVNPNVIVEGKHLRPRPIDISKGRHISVHFGPTYTVIVDDNYAKGLGVDKVALVKALKEFPGHGIDYLLTAGPDVEITKTTKSFDRIALAKAEATKTKMLHGTRSSGAPEGA